MNDVSSVIILNARRNQLGKPHMILLSKASVFSSFFTVILNWSNSMANWNRWLTFKFEPRIWFKYVWFIIKRPMKRKSTFDKPFNSSRSIYKNSFICRSVDYEYSTWMIWPSPWASEDKKNWSIPNDSCTRMSTWLNQTEIWHWDAFSRGSTKTNPRSFVLWTRHTATCPPLLRFCLTSDLRQKKSVKSGFHPSFCLFAHFLGNAIGEKTIQSLSFTED